MKITFVVDRVNNINEASDTQKLTDYICATPGCYAQENTNTAGWHYHNKALIREFVKNDYIDLVEFKNYSTNSQSFYVVNIANMLHLTNATFYNFLTEDAIDFLRKTNIPILLFYPLESTGWLQKNTYLNIIEKRNNLKLKNKIFLLSLVYYNDVDFNRFELSKLDDKLIDFNWIYSTCFFIRYTGKNDMGKSVVDYYKEQNKFIDKHNYNTKKYNFLCLNNSPSLNRRLILQLLFNNKNLWENNLISNRFYDSNILGTRADIHSIMLQENQKFMNENFKKFVSDLNFWQQAPVHIIPNDGPPEVHLNDSFLVDWYRDTVFTIVTETFAWTKNSFCNHTLLTEKTIKSFIMKHPFIIFSYNNNHKLCDLLGFKTFENLLGIPQDGEYGNLTTIERLFNLYHCLMNFDKTKLDIDKITEYTEYNYNHLVNTDWYEKQIDFLSEALQSIPNQ